MQHIVLAASGTDMDPISSPPHSSFAWLLAWRALLAGIALYTALEKPFWTMVSTLVVLGFLLFLGEAAYKSKVYFEQERLRKLKDMELREQRAKEAELRRAAMIEARQASRRSFMDLDDDEPSDSNAGQTKTPTSNGISPQDFDSTQLQKDAPDRAHGHRMSAPR